MSDGGEFETEAMRIASIVAPNGGGAWSNAFHHSLDLMLYARGERRTTRCESWYTPDAIERAVEAELMRFGISRGMRERPRQTQLRLIQTV